MDGTCSHTCTDDNAAERGCVHTVSVGAVGLNAGGSRLEALDGIQSNHFSGFNPPTEVEPLCLCVCVRVCVWMCVCVCVCVWCVCGVCACVVCVYVCVCAPVCVHVCVQIAAI